MSIIGGYSFEQSLNNTEIPMRDFDYYKTPEKLLTSEIVQMIGGIHEHKGKQELFLEANIDELKNLF